MLKYPIYQENEVLKKLEMIDFWAKNKDLDLQNLDRNIVLEIASELHPFYQYLWDAKTIGEWKVKYSNLSIKTRKMYTEEEVRDDWDARQSAKKRYTQIMDYLENSEYLLSQELQDKIEQYLKDQVIFPDRKFYFLNHDEVIAKYQKKIILTTTKRANEIDFNMIFCTHTNVWISETQVTQKLWTAVMGWNDSYFHTSFKDNPNLPVENITWYDCLFFCNQLSKLSALTSCYLLSNIQKDDEHITKADVTYINHADGYRLPTSTEWEYASKAGGHFRYSGSDRADDVAWFSHNSGILKLDLNLKYNNIAHENLCCTHTVKTKKPNQWGIYDMSGNVNEWCFERFNQNERVIKGGNCFDLENNLSYHDYKGFEPELKKNTLGLRVFRSANP